MQNAQLVGHFTKQGEEMDQLRGQRKMQCDVFKEVRDRVFMIAGKLRMALSESQNFQANDVGSYALFLKEFVPSLK